MVGERKAFFTQFLGNCRFPALAIEVIVYQLSPCYEHFYEEAEITLMGRCCKRFHCNSRPHVEE